MPSVAGFGGRITINAFAMRAHRWAVDWKVDDLDITSFENFGMSSHLGGIKDYDITFDAFWTTTDDPFNAPGAIIPGTYDAIVIRYVRTLGTQTWTFPQVLCLSVHNETSVRDVVRYTYVGKASEANISTEAVLGNTPTAPTAT